jgi:SMI1/KNR4 family protein SUKH-1
MAAKKAVVKKAVAKKAASRMPASASANDLAVEAGLTLSPALAELWALPPGAAFEEYDGLDPRAAIARRASLQKLLASAAFRARIKDNERFDDGGRVQAVHYDAGWIPFAEDGGGCLLCLDTNPGSKGKANQIIQWEMRGGGAFVRAASLKAFLKDIG